MCWSARGNGGIDSRRAAESPVSSVESVQETSASCHWSLTVRQATHHIQHSSHRTSDLVLTLRLAAYTHTLSLSVVVKKLSSG